MRRAVCPGSFDPVTNGHVDIIARAANLFDEVIALVVVNPTKRPSFTSIERVEMLKKSVSHLPNVIVEEYQGLLAEYVKVKNADAIVKGLRALSDFEYEFQMALTNKKLVPEAETVFLTTSSEHMYLSSSLVKQVASFSGEITDFVPDVVLEDIKKRLHGKSQNNNLM